MRSTGSDQLNCLKPEFVKSSLPAFAGRPERLDDPGRLRISLHGVPAFAAIAFAGAVALMLTLAFVGVLEADSYKALYDGRWIAQHGIPHREALTGGGSWSQLDR